MNHYSSNWYIIFAINYAIKWVEAKVLHTNIAAITIKFWYDHIFTQFNYPLTIATDQGAHFINDAIRYLTNHFILRHTSFTIYYPQGNGQTESTNEVFGTLLKKLVNEN
jgi:hypothetical protein